MRSVYRVVIGLVIAAAVFVHGASASTRNSYRWARYRSFGVGRDNEFRYRQLFSHVDGLADSENVHDILQNLPLEKVVEVLNTNPSVRWAFCAKLVLARVLEPEIKVLDSQFNSLDTERGLRVYQLVAAMLVGEKLCFRPEASAEGLDTRAWTLTKVEALPRINVEVTEVGSVVQSGNKKVSRRYINDLKRLIQTKVLPPGDESGSGPKKKALSYSEGNRKTDYLRSEYFRRLMFCSLLQVWFEKKYAYASSNIEDHMITGHLICLRNREWNLESMSRVLDELSNYDFAVGYSNSMWTPTRSVR